MIFTDEKQKTNFRFDKYADFTHAHKADRCRAKGRQISLISLFKNKKNITHAQKRNEGLHGLVF